MCKKIVSRNHYRELLIPAGNEVRILFVLLDNNNFIVFYSNTVIIIVFLMTIFFLSL